MVPVIRVHAPDAKHVAVAEIDGNTVYLRSGEESATRCFSGGIAESQAP